MSSTIGDALRLTLFGRSHGPVIGMTLAGIPAGKALSPAVLQAFLDRRAPGRSPLSTPRREADIPRFLSGLSGGVTTGEDITAVIENTDVRSADYESLSTVPRPGHADYTAQVKYGGCQDAAGGGHFSGRLTAPICIAGGLCIQWLAQKGIRVGAHIASIAGISDTPFDMVDPQIDAAEKEFPVLDPEAGKAMGNAILEAKSAGDSVGGVIECAVTGLSAGLGDPMFDGVENRIAGIVFGIPAVKGLEFGLGFGLSAMRGSQSNDPFIMSCGVVRTATNNCGGILGGITDGMPLIFRAAVKPTPSISIQQRSVSLSRKEEQELIVKGRHDPCIVPRAVPVIEAAAAIAVMDMILG